MPNPTHLAVHLLPVRFHAHRFQSPIRLSQMYAEAKKHPQTEAREMDIMQKFQKM